MVSINKELCNGCGQCIADCISMNLSLVEQKAECAGQCIRCGHCVAICPQNAASISSYDMKDILELSSPILIETQPLLDTIKSRRSIRHYSDNKIGHEALNNILQAGRYTATAANRQACKFIFVQEQLDVLKKLVWDSVEAAVSSGLEEAQPLKMLVDMRREKKIDYLFRNAPTVLYIAAENLWDAGMAAQNMELAAVSQGLGALYNGFLVRATGLSAGARKLLQLDGRPLAACMLLGYPARTYRRTAPRKPADVIWL